MLREIKILCNKYYWISIYYIIKERLSMQFGKSRTGILLPIMKPILYSMIYSFAINRVTGFQMENYTAFVMSGMAIWNILVSCIITANTAFTVNLHIIRVKPISKSMFAFAYIAEKMLLEGIATVIMILYIIIFLHAKITIITPLILIYMIIVIGFCIIITIPLSYISLYNMDIIMIISGGIPLMLWLTPILYPIENLHGFFGWISQYNPFYILINPFVQILYYNRLPSFESNIDLAFLCIITTAISYFIYKKLSKNAIYYIS